MLQSEQVEEEGEEMQMRQKQVGPEVLMLRTGCPLRTYVGALLRTLDTSYGVLISRLASQLQRLAKASHNKQI